MEAAGFIGWLTNDWPAPNDASYHSVSSRRKGALVFWNLAAPYGHVGLAKGDGAFWATSVSDAIGTRSLPYFSNYFGWAWPNF